MVKVTQVLILHFILASLRFIYRMNTIKVFYPLPMQAPISELSIEVTSVMLKFLIDDDAVRETEVGRFEFTNKGKDRIRQAPDPEW